MTIPAPVTVAVPPRLDLTVTEVGATRIAGVTLVLAITLEISAVQHGVGPHTATSVPAGSAAVKISGAVSGRAALPGTLAGRVLLKKLAVIVMPIGGGVADDVALTVSLPR